MARIPKIKHAAGKKGDEPSVRTPSHLHDGATGRDVFLDSVDLWVGHNLLAVLHAKDPHDHPEYVIATLT